MAIYQTLLIFETFLLLSSQQNKPKHETNKDSMIQKKSLAIDLLLGNINFLIFHEVQEKKKKKMTKENHSIKPHNGNDKSSFT